MLRRKAVLSLVALNLAVLAGCGGGGRSNEVGPGRLRVPPDTRSQVTITQGIWGNVWLWAGNFMPGSATGTITPIIRELYIYEPTKPESCTPAFGGYAPYIAVNTKLVTMTASNATGFFQAALPPGKYSVFYKQGPLYCAHIGDSDGYLQPVTVVSGTVSKIQLDIKDDASF